MVLGKYFKAPVDRKRYTIDYSDWLDLGELVSTVTFTVTPTSPTPVLIDGTSTDATGKIQAFYASGGVDGVAYKVFVTLLSSGGQTREDTVLFSVKAP